MLVKVISESVGTLEHVSRIIAASELKVGSVYNREKNMSEICVTVDVNNRTQSSGVETVMLARYSGSMSLNNGLAGCKSIPETFQLTQNSLKAWKEFVRIAEEILIQFVKEQ